MTPTILSIELGACLTFRTKTLLRELDKRSRQRNACGNAMLRYWQRWREDHPDWEPAQAVDRKGRPRFDAGTGKPIMEKPACGQQLGREMYAHGGKFAPELSSAVVSEAWNRARTMLAAKTPYNHDGDAKFVWEAVLAHEIRLPDLARGGARILPVPNNKSIFCYLGQCATSISRVVDQRMAAIGKDGCVLRFPLFSRKAGRDVTSPIVRLNVKPLYGGNRDILRRIAARELKMADSFITYHRKKGVWRLQLAYHLPTIDRGLDADRVAILTPMPPAAYCPFELRTPDGFVPLGDGKPFAERFEKWTLRKNALRARYRRGHAMGKGRGREFVYERLGAGNRAVKDMQDHFIKYLAADAVRECIKANCGTLQYREPSRGLRPRLWLDAKGVPMDWTFLASQVNHACRRNGIARPKREKRITLAEHIEEYGHLWPKPKPKGKGPPKRD